MYAGGQDKSLSRLYIIHWIQSQNESSLLFLSWQTFSFSFGEMSPLYMSAYKCWLKQEEIIKTLTHQWHGNSMAGGDSHDICVRNWMHSMTWSDFGPFFVQSVMGSALCWVIWNLAIIGVSHTAEKTGQSHWEMFWCQDKILTF